jgi:hypothetical protein
VVHSAPTAKVPYFTGATNILYTFGGHAVTVYVCSLSLSSGCQFACLSACLSPYSLNLISAALGVEMGVSFLSFLIYLWELFLEFQCVLVVVWSAEIVCWQSDVKFLYVQQKGLSLDPFGIWGTCHEASRMSAGCQKWWKGLKMDPSCA